MGAVTGALTGAGTIRNQRQRRQRRHESRDLVDTARLRLCIRNDLDPSYADETDPPAGPHDRGFAKSRRAMKRLGFEHFLPASEEGYMRANNPHLASDLSKDLIVIGGPAHGNGVTQALFGSSWADSAWEAVGYLPFDLPYTFVQERIDRKTAIRQERELGMIRPKWIVKSGDGDTFRSRKANRGRTIYDYLLLTKVPNVLYDADRDGRSIVNIAGLHGFGTRGFGPLLKARENERLLSELCERAEGSVQALYRVETRESRGHRARRLVRIGDGPIPLKLKEKDRDWARERVRSWMEGL